MKCIVRLAAILPVAAAAPVFAEGRTSPAALDVAAASLFDRFSGRVE